jgi:hypothetical protein
MKLQPTLRLSRFTSPPPAPPLVSFFEFWPGSLFYAPVVAHWIALGLRNGDHSLPTAANPSIAVGGLCGESKRDILDQVAGTEREVLARYTSIVIHGTHSSGNNRVKFSSADTRPVADARSVMTGKARNAGLSSSLRTRTWMPTVAGMRGKIGTLPRADLVFFGQGPRIPPPT